MDHMSCTMTMSKPSTRRTAKAKAEGKVMLGRKQRSDRVRVADWIVYKPEK